MGSHLDWARWYAARGWPVFPVHGITAEGACTCGKVECGAAGKHPATASGFKDASVDEAMLAAWWPDDRLGIAIPTGLATFDVIDADGAEGLATLDDWPEVPVGLTLTATTGGGGRHVLMTRSDAEPLRSRSHVLPGIDVKADGGYIVVAPSLHASGGSYSWWNRGDMPVKEIEPELLAALRELGLGGGRSSRGEDGRRTAEPVTGERLRDGRKRAMTSWAGALRRQGIEEDAIVVAMLAQNRMRCEPELPEALVREIVHSVSKYVPEADLASLWGLLVPEQPRRVELLGVELRLPGEMLTPVAEQLQRDLIGEEARRVRLELRAREEFVEPVSRLTLREELEIEDPPEPVWTVNGLWERGMTTSLTASYKAGKTVIQANLLRALVDERPFLDELVVRKLRGRVAVLNYELDEVMYRRWLRSLGIEGVDRACVLHLRGYRLDIASAWHRAWLRDWLKAREVEVLLVDPFARAYYGSENDNSEVKLWTDAIDELKREAGIVDAQIALHTGRGAQEEGAERARGATRLDDWVDARWVLTRDRADEGGSRYLYAEGRGVDFEERRLGFDPETLRAWVDRYGGSRRAERGARGSDRVVAALRDRGAVDAETGVGMAELAGLVGGNREEATRSIRLAETVGVVRMQPMGRRHVYWIAGSEML